MAGTLNAARAVKAMFLLLKSILTATMIPGAGFKKKDLRIG